MNSPIAVFDFDKTIVSKDSGTEYILFLLRRNKIRFIVAILWLLPGLVFMSFSRTRYFGSIFFLKIARACFTKKEIVNVEREFCRARFFEPKISAKIYEDAIKEIEKYVSSGTKVLVLTAAPQRVARELLRDVINFNKGKIIVVGTHKGKYCSGELKVEIAKSLDLDKNWIACYSDSARDFPILRRASKKYLVNPSEKTRRAAMQEFGEDVTVLHWR